MKVSVIIPTYNRSRSVCKTLDSLMDQDFPREDFEMVVVDNNSTDDTELVLQKYIEDHNREANIRYAKELRQGDGFARNSGAAIAKGDYLLFCDDDSLFDSNWISCLSGLLDMYPQIAMVGSRIQIKWDETPAPWVFNYEYLLGKCSRGEKGYIISSEGFCIANGSLGIRKNIFFEVGGNNPGQIGEYLVGNAEVGLYHKIKNLGYPIAFTDDTTMWHVQIKAKNGTLRDLIRREENCSISDAYSDVVERGIISKRNLAKDRKNLLKWFLMLKRTKLIKAYFTYRADKRYNEWVDKYRNKELLNPITMMDHTLGPNYKAPVVLYSTEYSEA